jgi:2-(1,2-epoxy-1,2-dihydrophenyl)acetyl-CoA isomerase
MSVTQKQVSTQLVLEERTGSVLTLRLNRPEKLNALNPELCRTLVHSLLRAGEDKSVRAVVLTGAGRGFCSGADIDFLREARSRKAVDEFKPMLEMGKEICLAIVTMPKVVIAAINGPAAGGGLSIALACDLRIASDKSMLTQAFGHLGLYPDFGATFFLPRLVGLSRASELFYTNERLSGEEAHRIGMVARIFPAASFEEETRKMAECLAGGPPLAYRDVKRTMVGEAHKEISDAIDEENRLQLHCFLSEDCAEGLAAYAEKRPPKFRGF